MEFINAGNQVPVANARYSHAVKHERTVYVAGWMGDDPKTGRVVEGGIEKQTVSFQESDSLNPKLASGLTR